jgi:hypothetical protein
MKLSESIRHRLHTYLRPIAFRRSKIPLAVKIVYTSFLSILIPTYLKDYGPTNFLYFCDVALLLTLAGVWLENSLLISMCSVGILLPQVLWLIDFAGNCVGIHLTGMTNYMFDPTLPLFTRGLSLFHGWLPLLLVWLLARVGYDKRAWPAWSVLASVLVLVCYFFLPAPGARPASSNIPVNVNYVYGFSDSEAQHWVSSNLYVTLWVLGLLLGAFLPTHLALRIVYRPTTEGTALLRSSTSSGGLRRPETPSIELSQSPEV